jgi:hypothetical protein
LVLTLETHLQQDTQELIEFYEDLVNREPTDLQNYLSLGLFYLLQEHEETAQATWLYAFAQVEEEEGEQLNQQLAVLLETAAEQQARKGEFAKSQILRQYLREPYSDSPQSGCACG